VDAEFPLFPFADRDDVHSPIPVEVGQGAVLGASDFPTARDGQRSRIPPGPWFSQVRSSPYSSRPLTCPPRQKSLPENVFRVVKKTFGGKKQRDHANAGRFQEEPAFHSRS
jgi:hypothetical protein